MRSLLFDSFAFLRFFQKEAGGEKVLDLLKQAADNKTPCLINAINVGEIIYLTQRRFGEQKKLEIFVHIQRMNIIILSCPNELIYRAAELKARFPLSYADAFALASAIEHGADLVSGDPEFKQVEHLVNIVWV